MRKTSWLASLLALAACGTEDEPAAPGGGGLGTGRPSATAGTPFDGHGESEVEVESAPAGCWAPASIQAPEGYPAFAVHSTDYALASIGLLDAEGKVLDGYYLSSGGTVDGLSAGLHTDVALPTTATLPDELTVVARSGGDYVLRVDLDDGDILGLTRTQASPLDMDGAAFSSNPQDYLRIDSETALVSRFEPNLDPGAAELEKGDDLLVLDVPSGERTDRISLDTFVETIEVDDGEGGILEDTAYARPGSIVALGCHALVGLSRLTSGFAGHPEGAVAVVDLPARTVSKLPLEGLSNCGIARPVPGDAERALVQCEGSPWGSRDNTGLALVRVDAQGRGSVEAVLRPEGAADPLIASGIVPLGESRVFAVAAGDFVEETPDVAYLVDMASGRVEEVFASGAAGEIGSGAYDPGAGRLYVPEASAGVRVFDVTETGLSEVEVVEVDPELPPRSVRALRAL